MNGKGNHQKSTSIVGHRDFFSFQQIEFEQIFERSIIDLRKLRPDESLLFASMICFVSRESSVLIFYATSLLEICFVAEVESEEDFFTSSPDEF